MCTQEMNLTSLLLPVAICASGQDGAVPVHNRERLRRLRPWSVGRSWVGEADRTRPP
jgi:hypothetical protein